MVCLELLIAPNQCGCHSSVPTFSKRINIEHIVASNVAVS